MLGLGESHSKASEFDRAAPPSRPPRSSRGRPASPSTSPERRSASAGVGSSRARPTPRSSRVLQEALAALPETDTAVRARLLGRLAMELHFANEPERCRALARQGVDAGPAAR